MHLDLIETGHSERESAGAAVMDLPRIEGSAEQNLRASVIIPTLNESLLIENTLSQFTPDIRSRLRLEVIVSDGGSDDETVEIAGLRADRIVCHHKPERQTIAEGRNAGAEAAAGEVLLFFNADVRLPDRLEEFLQDLIAAASRRQAATCRVRVDPSVATRLDRAILGFLNAFFWFLNLLGIGMGRGECHAVRRTVFNEVGGYREDLVAGEDFDLFKRIARYNRRNRYGHIAYLWKWVVYEDPRRYRKIGYARTIWQWFLNAVSILIRGKSASSEWTPFR